MLVSIAEFYGKQINCDCRSKSSVAIMNFRISQGSVATQFKRGGNFVAKGTHFPWNLTVKVM